MCGKRYLELLGYQISIFIGLLCVLGTPSPVALPFPTSIQSFFDLLTVSSCWLLPLRSLVCLVIMRDRVNCIGRGGWGGRTIIRIYKKKSICNKTLSFISKHYILKDRNQRKSETRERWGLLVFYLHFQYDLRVPYVLF